MRRFRIAACLALVGLLLGALAGAADKNAKVYQEQFERFSRIIADLKAADVTDALGQDIEVIRTGISQAQAYLAAEKLEAIDPVLERIGAQAEYVRAKLNRIEAEEAAAEAEGEAAKVEKAATDAKAAADEAERKNQELEAKGL